MPIAHQILRVYEASPSVTVVGFGGAEIVDQLDLSECREEIVSLLNQNDCKMLAIDLTGVRYIPSGMLGLLASLCQMGIEVHLYNPSEDIREVLQITRLDDILQLHDIEV